MAISPTATKLAYGIPFQKCFFVKDNVEKIVLWKVGKEKTIWLTLSEEFN